MQWTISQVIKSNALGMLHISTAYAEKQIVPPNIVFIDYV